ncbi:CaiB/BaiF CoA-transferase family protein [Microbacterium pseudoresistens]|uniref:Crotonobetainyl-CoA:carnitine CoA-transferase CaiB-like acyl-CoA transferase n=1 Tax=Microbacterium pseudoresistens TaxID=640634 RepID=A0A7Y9JNJ5_9MICO|nr:CoA transferase [Microbacterium pseudoresistens]NYD54608.1 crotonobetainyl-CoA:carnitine CoA-transferase CaiB-like acyl-CoA transferase [Microbacterium pseudoresistens]
MTSPSAPPLDGLLVADFSRVLAGPYATMMLADLGAEVIKVESPGGDETRGWKPPVREERSTYYLAVNRGKRSVVLDLTDPEDRRLAQRLAARADILVENMKPGGMAKFGLDYDSVRAMNERIVYASISGFGPDGGRDLPGYDLIVQSISGLMSLTGDHDGPAYRSGVSVFDVAAGNHALIGILAALHGCQTTGAGQHIEVNLLSSALSVLANHSSAYIAGGVVPYRMGNAHPSVFPYEPLPTKNGELIIAAANDRQFHRLCETLGAPELAARPEYASNESRTAHRESLRPLLVELLATRSAEEWFEALMSQGVPCGPINTIDGGFAFAEKVGLAPVVMAGHGESAVPTARNPIRFSTAAHRYDLAPPQLDEHGTEVRRWLQNAEERDRR